MESVKKAHDNGDGVYCIPFERDVYRVQELCTAAEGYLEKNIRWARKVKDTFPPRYEKIDWKPYPCDTRANMQWTMEAVEEAHRYNVSTYRMPFGNETYGSDLFSEATSRYIREHTTAATCHETMPPKYENLKWKPYPCAPAAVVKYDE